jgi:hypothetical protein
MFCAPELIFIGTVGVGSRSHVLRNRTNYRRRRVSFPRFSISDSFSAVPRASCPILMFCTPGLIFGGIDGVASRFHVLRSRTHFRQYRGRRVAFSCFALPDSFSAVPRALGSVFNFCATGLIFGGIDGIGSRFHVFAPGLIFDGTNGLMSCFHVLRSKTHFRPYRRRRVPFSCFSLPDSFSAVSKASGPVSCFALPDSFYGSTVGVGSRFHVLRLGLIFDGNGGAGYRFHILSSQTQFRRYRGRRVSFSYFAQPD